MGAYKKEKENVKQLFFWCADDKETDNESGEKFVVNMAAPMMVKVTGRTELEHIFNMLAYRWRRDHRRYADCLTSNRHEDRSACACPPRTCPRALRDAMKYPRVANKHQVDHKITEGNGRA